MEGKVKVCPKTGRELVTFCALHQDIWRNGNFYDTGDMTMASMTTDYRPRYTEILKTLQNEVWFNVDHVDYNPDNVNLCMMWGDKGVLVAEVENDGSNMTLKREVYPGEVYYKQNANFAVYKCRWLSSTVGYFVVVLNSDSFLRVYNAVSGELLGYYNFGPPDAIPHMTKWSAEISFETPVDFDVGPIIEYSKTYPILVLRRKGDVYMALISVPGKSRCTMYSIRKLEVISDSAVDLSEENFSSIECSKSFPTVIVMAQDSGRLSHSILLPINSDVSYEYNEDSLDAVLSKATCGLFVKEQTTIKSDINVETFLRIKLDPFVSERYICIHSKGVDVITINLMQELLSYFENPEKELTTLSPCTYQIQILWQIDGEKSEANSFKSAVFLPTLPRRVLCILHEDMRITFTLPCNNSSQYNKSSSIGESSDYRASGDNLLQNILSSYEKQESMPMLCIQRNVKESHAMVVLRKAIDANLKRIIKLENDVVGLYKFLLTVHQKSNKLKANLDKMNPTKLDLKAKAESIAEKYEEASDADFITSKRVENIIKRYQQTCPVFTHKEVAWKKNFEDINDDVNYLKTAIGNLKERTSSRRSLIPIPKISLAPSQLQIIRDEISLQHKIILEMTACVREIEKIFFDKYY